MKIAYFYANKYWKIIGDELKNRGHDIKFNSISVDTELCIIMGAQATFMFNNMLEQLKNEEQYFKYKGKIANVVFDIPIWRLDNPKFKNFYIEYEKILKKSDYVLTISDFTTKQLKQIWNIDGKTMFNAFNDIFIDKYKKKIDRKKQIIMVSRFVKHKRFDLVIKAIKNTDWKLIMCGRPGPYLDYYKQLAEQNKIDYELYINPSDEFVIEKYCESQVCIQPSNFEGLSLVPKEALWCNTPVIISDIEVNKEFHKDFVNYFKVDDLEDLKKIINSELKPAEKKHLEPYRIKNVITRTEDWLKSLNTK